MRVTTNMVMRNYQNHLYNTVGGLESSRYQVESQRKFSDSYQDPAAAARANILEYRYARNADYQDNVLNTMKWQDVQEDSVMEISNICTTISSKYSVEAITGTSGVEGKDAIAQALREMQQSMVQVLNNKYGNSFVLGGNGGSEQSPFELSEDGKTLLYRGIDVNDPANKDVLDELSKETAYIDLGFGLTYDDAGEIMPSSAYNYCLPGINVVGYGQNDEGVSNNIVLLAGQMAEVLEAEEFDQEQYEKLWNQFQKTASDAQNVLTEIGTKTDLLKNTQSRLEDEAIAIQEQYNNEIGIDTAEAIMNYSWASYAYNAALKIGTSIIGPSLLDFMQ